MIYFLNDYIDKLKETECTKDEIKEVVHEMALKKYNVLCKRESDDYKLSQKLFRFLMGKGYDYDD
mgnify:CR=1 FL=1